MLNLLVKTGLVLILIISIGCASRQLVPLADGGKVDPILNSSQKTYGGVTITVNSSPWQGSPYNLEYYLTPFYVEIQNNSPKTLYFHYDNIVLLDARRTQFNPLTPELAAQTVKISSRGTYAYGPYYPRLSVGIGFGSYYGWPYYRRPYYWPYYYPFRPFGFFPYRYYPPVYYRPPQVGDIFSRALIPGQVIPGAKLQGYIYFQKLPKQVEQITLNISYILAGEPSGHILSFPFVYIRSTEY